MAKKNRIVTKGARAASVELLSLDLTIVVRASRLDSTRVQQYLAAMTAGDEFPPIEVYEDPETGELRVVDGHHRVEAALLRGLTHFPATIFAGNWQEALFYALKLGRGLLRTNADKQHCVEVLLGVAEWAEMSNGKLGQLAGVTPKTVQATRVRLGLVTSVRRTTDGRVMDVSRIGSRKTRDAKTIADPTSTREFPECAAPVEAKKPDISLDLAADGTPSSVHDGVRLVSWRVVSSEGRILVEGRVQQSASVTMRRGDVIETISDGSHLTAAARKLRGE